MGPWIFRRQFPLILVFVAGCALPCLAEERGETALDRYMRRPDPEFRWSVVRTIPGEGSTTHVLEMVSQSWRSKGEVDRPEWTHWLTIVVPESVKSSTGLLFIGAGANGKPAPEEAPARVQMLALATNTVCAELGMVPNQPLTFADTPDEHRVEDDLIAYSRVQYMRTGDETWLVRLAMVKSAVRAMDAMQQFLKGREEGSIELKDFVVAGGSKRGWTTWLTAVVDARVKAIVPLVIDALNSEAITRHHYEAYGFFSRALDDYVRHGLFPDKVGTPEYRRVLEIEDPIHYRHRERLRIPKYLINAAGDEFFLPDNSRLYFAELPEEKYLRYIPNAKHSLANSDVLESFAAFYESVLQDGKRPRFSWKIDKEGTIRVKTIDRPASVHLWQATNPDARDFRLDVIGPAYASTPLKSDADGVFIAKVPKPEKGFTAYFVELVYPTGGKYPFKFTTDVAVIPDILPYDFDSATKQKGQ